MRAYGRAGIVALIWVVVAAPGALAQSLVGVLGITREIAPIEHRLQDVREVPVKGYVFRVGTLNGRQVVVGRSGVGKVNAAIHALRMRVERTFAWEDKCKRLLLRFERIQQRHYGMKLMAYTLINLRGFCGV